MTQIAEMVLNPDEKLRKILDNRTYLHLFQTKIDDNYGFALSMEVPEGALPINVSEIVRLTDISISVNDSCVSLNSFDKMMGTIPAVWAKYTKSDEPKLLKQINTMNFPPKEKSCSPDSSHGKLGTGTKYPQTGVKSIRTGVKRPRDEPIEIKKKTKKQKTHK